MVLLGILLLQCEGEPLIVRRVSHDNGAIVGVLVNDGPAKTVDTAVGGLIDWEIQLPAVGVQAVVAATGDRAKKIERNAHGLAVD